MAKRIEIRLLDNPSNNDYVVFFPVSPSQLYSNLITCVFKSVPTTGNITIGATQLESETNLYNYIVSRLGTFGWMTITQVSGGVDIFLNAEDVTFTSVVDPIVGDITLTFVDVEVATFTRDNIILSRSPYHVLMQPSMAFDLAILNLKIYRGTQTTDAPINFTVTSSKQVIQAGQNTINFDIHKLVNDYCKSNIPTFGLGINTSTVYDSVWIDAEVTAYYLGENIGTVNRKYYAIDGFGWHTELYNPTLTTNVLSSITNHIVYTDTDYPIYFVTKDLTDIIVDGSSVGFTLDDTINNQLVAYLNVRGYIDGQDTFTISFVYDTVTETHTIIVKEACKYPLYECFFKNKYGFWQSIPFNLRNKRTINSESNKYSPVISRFGQYSLHSHSEKTYLPSAKEVITCNTDFLPEDYNVLFEELMLSEFVYLANDGVVLPVNLNKTSLEKKTRLFDKLIQYTFDFEYSFNLMNTVI